MVGVAASVWPQPIGTKDINTEPLRKPEVSNNNFTYSFIGKEVNHQSQLYVCVLYCYT
jgi:hypothetical protein